LLPNQSINQILLRIINIFNQNLEIIILYVLNNYHNYHFNHYNYYHNQFYYRIIFITNTIFYHEIRV